MRGSRNSLASGGRCIGGKVRLALPCAVAALCLASPSLAVAQEVSPPVETLDTPPFENPKLPLPKPPVASEITVEGLVSYGNYKIFASGENCKLYDLGIEYDRHSWGHFLGARVDYVAEVLPMVLLNQPTQMDIWGLTLSPNRKIVPGVDIAPMGFRWLWRDGKAIKPYLMAKGGVLVFSQKALTSQATYENFSLQSAGGLQIKINERFDLRLGLFGDFHFSDGFIVPANPGLDVMNATMGLTYHLGGKRQTAVH
jgi:hypothetical protein